MIKKLLETARVMLPYVVKEILRQDSLDLTAADRGLIVTYIQATGSSRIVITHGTDTMTETAEALRAFTDRTIVLTGLCLRRDLLKVTPRSIWDGIRNRADGSSGHIHDYERSGVFGEQNYEGP